MDFKIIDCSPHGVDAGSLSACGSEVACQVLNSSTLVLFFVVVIVAATVNLLFFFDLQNVFGSLATSGRFDEGPPGTAADNHQTAVGAWRGRSAFALRNHVFLSPSFGQSGTEHGSMVMISMTARARSFSGHPPPSRPLYSCRIE